MKGRPPDAGTALDPAGGGRRMGVDGQAGRVEAGEETDEDEEEDGECRRA